MPSLAFSTVGGAAIEHLRLDDAIAATVELVDLLNTKPLSWAREAQASS